MTGAARQLPAALPAPPTVADRLVSVALWTAGLAWMVPMMTGMTALSWFVHPRRTDALSRLYCRGQIALTGARWRAVVHPDVDPAQPYLFAQNHVNLLDHVMLYPATPHFKQGMELAEHFRIPVYGWFMRARGTIPVVRGRRNQLEELTERVRREVELGHSILAFPEGTRTKDGRVGRFRKGIFLVARDVGLPIVPVAVTGSYEVLRKGSALMRPGGRVTVWCEKPVPTAGVPDAEIPDLIEHVRRVVADRVDRYWDGDDGG